MSNEQTGPLRKIWNKFKRGMSEINFILNITQTLVILWVAETARDRFLNNFWIYFGISALFIFVCATITGGYAIKEVDPTMSILNPFAQDMVKQRRAIAKGLYFASVDRSNASEQAFREAVDITERWIEE